MSTIDEILKAAQKMVGVRYLWGGNDPSNGVDCSGFVQQAFLAAGIQLPRVSNQQAAAGAGIDLASAQPGDLVSWDLNGRNEGADHIGIYLGNGLVIEASSSRGQVVVRKLWGNPRFTRVAGAEGGGQTAPGTGPATQAPSANMGAIDTVSSPVTLTGGQEEGPGGAFNLDFLRGLVDESDPGETPDTVGPYGVAKQIFDVAKAVAG